MLRNLLPVLAVTVPFTSFADESLCVDAAQITFETKNDDKDADTRVWAALLRSGDGAEMGRTAKIAGHFDDNTSNGPYNFNIVETRARGTSSCALPYAVVVHMEPNGNDTWIFSIYVRYRTQSGQILEGRTADFRLRQDHKEENRLVNFSPAK